MVNKTIILTMLFFFGINYTLEAQDSVISDVNLVSALESFPSFNNDRKGEKLSHIIRTNLNYTDTITEQKIVYVRFLVDTLGNTHNHEILLHVDDLLDEEALRVCRLIKFDNPAKQHGKPVCIYYTIPVDFSIPCSTEKKRNCIFKNRKNR